MDSSENGSDTQEIDTYTEEMETDISANHIIICILTRCKTASDKAGYFMKQPDGKLVDNYKLILTMIDFEQNND